MPSEPDITALLTAWTSGHAEALDELLPIVEGHLRSLAHHCMNGERTGHPLQTTALINEAYLRLVDIDRIGWQDRSHFFAMCARLMRRVLVDVARAHRSRKRGCGLPGESLDPDLLAREDRREDVVAIDEALDALAAVDSRKAQVVELRFFGGLSVQETAELLGVSVETVMRDWRLARVWLLRQLTLDQSDAR